MEEKEFIEKAKAAGYSDEYINEVINDCYDAAKQGIQIPFEVEPFEKVPAPYID